MSIIRLTSILTLTACMLQSGCKKSDNTAQGGTETKGKTTIRILGSDTMVNLAQAWAEEYDKVDPSVELEVSGGGSGQGIAALINGTIDIANASRAMKPEEIAKATQNTGKEPKEHVVGHDALAVYVHKNNPLAEITLEQLGKIYGEKGDIVKWSQLGVQNAACPSDEIIRVSRQSNSGTYEFFREAILGKGDFKLGSRDLHGSKDVVELVAQTACAIGYSGMGYNTPDVKMLNVAKKAGDKFFVPNIDNTLSGAYPIARPLIMYTLGEPTGATKAYLDWIHSDAGQQIVAKSGYVPLPKKGQPTP